jgi:antirestriction protein ArdC
MATQNEIRQKITDQILESLAKGCAPWRRPWRSNPNSGSAANAVSKRRYTGVNPLLLSIAAQKHGFQSRFWASYNQWSQDLNCQVMSRPIHVRPGEWGTSVVFCKPCKKTTTDKNGREVEEQFFMLRQYVVFNADQVSGAERFRVSDDENIHVELDETYQKADEVIERTGANIIYAGDEAFYSPVSDVIHIPPRHQFTLPELYDTVFHELCHWTEPRLGWDRNNPENSYALGELIAELGCCYLAGEIGLPLNETLPNHAAYLQNWLGSMREDARFIFRATAQACRAADFILSFSRSTADTESELVA